MEANCRVWSGKFGKFLCSEFYMENCETIYFKRGVLMGWVPLLPETIEKLRLSFYPGV